MSEVAAVRPVQGQQAKPLAAHRIDSDEEALQVARHWAGEFARDAARRDSERILPWAELEGYSQSGLWGITVPRNMVVPACPPSRWPR
jgi:alkylation response protein AidB-like acyl-CoA dehydrogenase